MHKARKHPDFRQHLEMTIGMQKGCTRASCVATGPGNKTCLQPTLSRHGNNMKRAVGYTSSLTPLGRFERGTQRSKDHALAFNAVGARSKRTVSFSVTGASRALPISLCWSRSCAANFSPALAKTEQPLLAFERRWLTIFGLLEVFGFPSGVNLVPPRHDVSRCLNSRHACRRFSLSQTHSRNDVFEGEVTG